MARPRKMTKARCELFLNAYGATGNKTKAAKSVGVAKQRIDEKIAEDPEFAQAMDGAFRRAMTPETQAKFCENYSGSGNVTTSAAAAGVSQWTIERMMEHDPDFAAAVQEAYQDFGSRVATVVVRRATVGDTKKTTYKKLDPESGKVLGIEEKEETYFDPQCLKALREAVVPEFSVPMRHEVSGPGGGPIPVRADDEYMQRVIDALTEDELDELETLEQRRLELLNSGRDRLDSAA